MKMNMTQISGMVDRLLDVLDVDILHITENLERLNALRSFVIKRDNDSLSRLLQDIQSETNSYKVNETKRQMLRKQLAIALGYEFEKMNLSRLQNHLDDHMEELVAERKMKLRALTAQLKKEHLSTTMLLMDCARFNSKLLNGIFEFGRKTEITYSRRGSANRQSGPAFVNLKF